MQIASIVSTVYCLTPETLHTLLMSVSYVRDDWKTAIIVPVYKKGPTTNVVNYRPISLTSVASKIMERVISVQMTSF